MTKSPPPLVLIETWLFFVSSNSKDFNNAKKNAQRQLALAFGSVEIAQVYYDHQISLLKKVHSERGDCVEKI